MIIKDILDRVSKVLQDYRPETREDIKQWILDCKIDMLRYESFECMKRTHTFTADGNSVYVLPQDFVSIIRCVANGLIIPNYLSNYAAGIRHRIIDGYSIGEIVSVESDNSNDTTPVVSLSEERLVSEAITLQGTTPVLSSGQFAKISFIYKDQSLGKVTIKRQSGPDICILPKNKVSYYIRSIEFTTALTGGDVVIEYLPNIELLSDDYAVDALQVKFHSLIIDYCCYRGFGDQDNGALEQKHYSFYTQALLNAIKEERKNRRKTLSATVQPRL